MNTLTNKLNRMAVSAQILKARCAEMLSAKEGSVSDYAWVIIIGIVLAGIILVMASGIIKTEVANGLKTKISEFFSFT